MDKTTSEKTLDVSRTARMSGTKTLSSTLDVTGVTKLNITLVVTSTLTGNVMMIKELTVSGTLTVTSDATVSTASVARQTLALKQDSTDVFPCNSPMSHLFCPKPALVR